MKRIVLFIASALLVAGCCQSPQDGSTHLNRNNESGVNTAVFDQLFDDVSLSSGTAELHGVVVIKDNSVIYEHYDEGHQPGLKHALWSASKTFTATAIGFAVQDGLLSVDDPVVKFFNEDELPSEPCDYLQKLTVKNLLTMSSGFEHDYLGDTQALVLKNPTVTQLNDSFIFEPGTKFKYNSMNTYLLSVIVTKLTGKTTADYLSEKLFTPLGIKDFYWKESAEGVSMGGWGLFISTEDLAKMGLFFLNKGTWEGKQLLSESWIKEASSAQIMPPLPEVIPGRPSRPIEEDWVAGYGYQMWRNDNGSYRLDGAWGQFCIISEEKNAVIAVNALTGNAQALLRLVMKDIYDKL